MSVLSKMWHNLGWMMVCIVIFTTIKHFFFPQLPLWATVICLALIARGIDFIRR